MADVPVIFSTPITLIRPLRKHITFPFPAASNILWTQFCYIWTGVSSCEVCIYSKGKNGLLHQLHEYMLYTPRLHHNLEFPIPSFPENKDDATIIISFRLPFCHDGGNLRVHFLGKQCNTSHSGNYMLLDNNSKPKWLIYFHSSTDDSNQGITLRSALHRTILEEDTILHYTGALPKDKNITLNR